MNPWLLLIPAFLLFCAGSWVSYSDKLRNSYWFLPIYLSTAVLCSFIWVYSARILPNKEKIYLYSISWDLLMITAYYLLPVIILSFEFKLWTWVGLGFILFGIFLIKVSS